MSEGILGKAIYRCNQCNVKHYLNNDDFDFQIESCDIRNMGEENQYVAEFSENCHQCNNEISLRFEAWEYPVGILNSTNETATGAEILESDIDIYHEPPYDSVTETIELVKPLLTFRFDKFSEIFVDLWVKSYKRVPTQTTIFSLFGLIVGLASLVISINVLESKRFEIPKHSQNYEQQQDILRQTEINLNNLSAFIISKKAEIDATQTLIKDLEQEKSQLEPIVNANKEVIDAIFTQQRKDFEKSIWIERGISFGLGILASLLASIIWHFVTRLKTLRK